MSFTPDLKNNPPSVGVYTRILEQFLEVVGPATIVTTKGRCIHVRKRSGAFPSFGDLACDLLGWSRPCDEFSVYGPDLYARLKCISQVCADNNAADIDEVFGEFGYPTVSTDGLRLHLDSTPSTSTGGRPARRKKPKVPDGAAKFVMRVLERDVPIGEIEIDKLVELTEKAMPPKLDSEGKNRSKKYIRAAITKLVELELLYLHNETQVSLLALVTGNANEPEA